MIPQIHKVQSQAGATFRQETLVPVSFSNDNQAFRAAYEGVALGDRSHWGLIRVSGEERLRFLHNQSTNDFNSLLPGRGCETVFVNSTARTIDLATAYVTKEEVLLIIYPGKQQEMLQWLDRFLFPMDKVELEDLSTEYAIFSLLGPQSSSLLREVGVETLPTEEYQHQLVELDSCRVRVAGGNGLAIPGYTLLVPSEEAASIWQKLHEAGAVPLGEQVWESLRIQQGRPVPARELTEAYNPLEAGLVKQISFNKGCYIGQETIARLNTYQGVKQRLWGVKLSNTVAPGTDIKLEEKKVGKLTSCTATEEGAFGLAYVRTKAGGEGTNIKVGRVEGKLVAVPFLNHEYYLAPEKG